MPSSWITIDGDDIIPQEVQDAIDQLEPLLEAALIPLETAQDALDLLAGLLGLIDSNPIQALIGALIKDLVETQVSVLFIKPQFSRIDQPGGMSRFGRTMKQAFADNSDFQRPTFDAGDVSGGVIFLVNAPSFAEIASIAEAFSSIFGDRWRDILDLVAALPGQPVPFFRPDATGLITSLVDGESARSSFVDSTRASPNGIDLFTGTKVKMVTGLNTLRFSTIQSFDPETGTFRLSQPFDAANNVGDAYIVSEFVPSRPPDWTTLRLVDVVPPVRQIVRVLQEVSDLLEPPVGFSKLLQQLILAINQKIVKIQTIINNVQELVDLIQTIGSVTNVNMLPVSFDVGGNGRFVQEFEFAANKPPVDDDNVSLGLVVYGGAGTTAIMKVLFPQIP